MSEELGVSPRTTSLATRSESRAEGFQLKTVSIRPASLDAPISDDDSTEFGEIVGDEEAQTPFELLRDKNLRNEVGGLLDVLDDREKKIIFSGSGWTAANQRRSRKSVKNSALRERDSAVAEHCAVETSPRSE